MATCSYCGSTILFGGRSVGEFRFCHDKCLAQGQRLIQAQFIPADVVGPVVESVHRGNCPVCNGPGPVDVLTAHVVISALVVTWWKSEPRVSCRSCGTRKQVQALAVSLLSGWWGVPHGLFMTPVQTVRNIRGLMQPVTAGKPSPALERLVRLSMAETAAAETTPAGTPRLAQTPAASAPAPAPAPRTGPDLTALRAALKSADPKIREVTASALGDLGATALPALPDLERLQQDPDRSVRTRAARAVEEVRRKSGSH